MILVLRRSMFHPEENFIWKIVYLSPKRRTGPCISLIFNIKNWASARKMNHRWMARDVFEACWKDMCLLLLHLFSPLILFWESDWEGRWRGASLKQNLRLTECLTTETEYLLGPSGRWFSHFLPFSHCAGVIFIIPICRWGIWGWTSQVVYSQLLSLHLKPASQNMYFLFLHLWRPSHFFMQTEGVGFFVSSLLWTSFARSYFLRI